MITTNDSTSSVARHSSLQDPGRQDFPHGWLTNRIIGGIFEVHNALGAGFLEAVYANALTVELRHHGLAVDRNVPFAIVYRGAAVGRYLADLIVERTVLVETKVARAIDTAHRAQVLNYLRASALEVGLVVNFGTSVQFKRVVASRPAKPLAPTPPTATPTPTSTATPNAD